MHCPGRRHRHETARQNSDNSGDFPTRGKFAHASVGELRRFINRRRIEVVSPVLHAIAAIELSALIGRSKTQFGIGQRILNAMSVRVVRLES